MGDFARIAKAVGEPGLKLYISRLGTAAADIVEADPFARALIKFADTQPWGRWEGLASDLVAAIPVPEPLPKGWPRDPTRFGVWVKRLARVLESAAGIRITKGERTAQGQPYTLERIPSEDPATQEGNPATSVTQLQDGSQASKDARPPDVADDQLQLHSYTDDDQRRCSSVADVAEIPASQDRIKKDIPAEADDTTALSLIGAYLGATPSCPGCGSDEDSIIHAVNCLGEDPAA